MYHQHFLLRTVYPKLGLYDYCANQGLILACQSMEELSETESPASFGEASSSQVKRRRPITDVQRKDLRVHKRILIQKNGTWSISEMIDFFYKKHDRVLSKSSISESLSDRFSHLDKQYATHPDSKRKHDSRWPDLEAALFDWHQRELERKGTVTNQVLKEMAKKFFYGLPQYHNMEPPGFATPWIEKFKARYNISDHARNVKSNVIDRLTIENEFEDLRDELKLFEYDDIYTMDETALFWKMSPEDPLVGGGKAGSKSIKAQITVMLACNVTGSQKLPPWVIGKARNPRCLEHSGVYMENLPITWQYNGKALMTGILFEEYVRWFDGQMTGRNVCLLVDELSAHVAGKELLSWDLPESLANIKLVLFSTNTPSVHQPLDQGVIRSWKAHYRRRWLTYMCNEYITHGSPLRSTNILKAIRWLTDAWENDVTPISIRNCWNKSGLLAPDSSSQDEAWKDCVYEDNQAFNDTMAQIQRQIEYLAQTKRIRSAMSVATFVSPADETVDDDDDDDGYHFESLLEAYSTSGAVRDYETDEEDVTVAPILEGEALDLLSRLRLYEEQQENGNKVAISSLNRYEREIRARLTP